MKYKYNGQWVDVTLNALEGMPIGSIIQFAGSAIPTGWLKCDGSSLSEEEYPQLYDVIGHTYGGSGLSFNLPNFKGRVPVGQDTTQTEFDTIGETGGSKYLQEHNHKITNSYYEYANLNYGRPNALFYSGSQVTGQGTRDSGYVSDLTTGNSGNLQPYLVVNYIIKATQTTPTFANVVNGYSTSTKDGYCCDYINEALEDVYSTTETKTNKVWIDGKPIYKKVIEYTISNTINTYVSIAHNINDIETKVSCETYYLYSNEIYKVPNSEVVAIKFSNSNFSYVNKTSGLSGSRAYTILEYTKTTD